MKLLQFLTDLRRALAGSELRRTLIRNEKAADDLDRAVKEMLGK